MFLLGLQAAAWRVPFLPTRVGLGSDVRRAPARDPHRRVALRRRRGAGRRARARTSTSRSCTCTAATQRGNGQYLNVDPYFDDLFCMAAPRALHERRADRADRATSRAKVRSQTLRINRLMTDGVVEAPHGAHFTECVPDYGRDEAFQTEYAASAQDADAWAGVAAPSTSTAATTPSTGRWSGCDAPSVTSRPRRRAASVARRRRASAATARSWPTRSAPSR